MSSWNNSKPHFRDKSSYKNNIILTQLQSVDKQKTHYRLAENWLSILPSNEYNRPIHYLEIGTRHGDNLLCVANFYGLHNDSQLHCIDPWEDYDEYPEYKGNQQSSYDIFNNNINESIHKDKIYIHRGFSDKIVPTFDDLFFDIIYIDGNHEPEYVLEDAVLSFRKLKKGGIMIFDDYGWGGPDLTQRGIDGFLSGYHKRINVLTIKESQVFVKKL
jgi:hypothetical protein